MALHNDVNMQEIPAPDDLIPEGDYHVRISRVEEKESNQGKPMVVLTLKVQNEGVAFGRQFAVFASLAPNALFTLKGFYKACGYNPGSEGHDPEKLLDMECYVTVTHQVYEGQTRVNVPPYSIKSLTDGPAVRRS